MFNCCNESLDCYPIAQKLEFLNSHILCTDITSTTIAEVPTPYVQVDSLGSVSDTTRDEIEPGV